MSCECIVKFPLYFQGLHFGFFDFSLQLGREILDVLFIQNLNGLIGVNKSLSKSSQAQRVVCQCLTSVNGLLKI